MSIKEELRFIAKKNAREKYLDLDGLDSLTREEKIKNEYNKLLALYNSWNRKLSNNRHLQFKFNKFSYYQQATLIDIIQKIVSSEVPLFQSTHKIPNKQIIKKFDNIDIDVDWSNIISEIKEYNYYDKRIHDYYIKVKINMKKLIRQEKSNEEVEKGIFLFVENEKEWFVNNQSDDNYTLKLTCYADICSYIVGQLLNYKILNNDRFQNMKKTEILDAIIKSDIYYTKHKYKNNSKSILKAFIDFIYIFNYYNIFSAQMEISEHLSNEKNNKKNGYNNIAKRFKMKAQKDIDFMFRENVFMKFCLEKNEKELSKNITRFKEEISEVKKAIETLKRHNINDLQSFNTQHIKVMYREIFLDEDKFLGVKSRTIITHLEKEDYLNFVSNKEYVYLRGKISRGLFREKGLLEHYYKKSIIVNRIFKDVIEIIQNYDTNDIQKCLTEYYINAISNIFCALN